MVIGVLNCTKVAEIRPFLCSSTTNQQKTPWKNSSSHSHSRSSPSLWAPADNRFASATARRPSPSVAGSTGSLNSSSDSQGIVRCSQGATEWSTTAEPTGPSSTMTGSRPRMVHSHTTRQPRCKSWRKDAPTPAKTHKVSLRGSAVVVQVWRGPRECWKAATPSRRSRPLWTKSCIKSSGGMAPFTYSCRRVVPRGDLPQVNKQSGKQHLSCEMCDGCFLLTSSLFIC